MGKIEFGRWMRSPEVLVAHGTLGLYLTITPACGVSSGWIPRALHLLRRGPG